MPTLHDLGMDRPKQQECFGDAFLVAVAGAAGCATSQRRPDDDSIDWTLSCKLPSRPKLDVQMKTWVGDDGGGTEIRYPLARKNYDDLILDDLSVPRILVLVTVPRSVEDWTTLSADELTLRRCGYWVSLLRLPPVDNEHTVTVTIPRSNVLTAHALQEIMRRIDNGGAP